MKQYTENQYDDDLTVGTDDYDDSYYTGSVDLFEFSNDEESPISRLKSLILSIDWEITDEILMQFNDELLDLRDIWAGEKIHLVYVQALEKISKYIYQKKADSHPSAIKLLLTLYHNLEKIVSSSDLTEEQKKEILLEDVKRFESLKRHISQHSSEPFDKPRATEPYRQKSSEDIAQKKDLLNLKAIVLGIDWEITDEELNALRQEVVRLEEKFADSRPKLLLLQGIGTLGAYIKLKKSNAHADAFKILHLFYESFEKIVATPMSLEEEKAILFPAVDKFNSFKTLLGSTIAPESIGRTDEEDDQDAGTGGAVIAPAFADLPEEEVMGFQAEEEARSLGLESSSSVDDHIENFFTGKSFPTPESPVRLDGTGAALERNHQVAVLQGVDVEEDDQPEPGEMPAESRMLDPALSAAIEDDQSPIFQEEELARDGVQVTGEERSGLAGDKFAGEAAEQPGPDFSTLARDVVLQGVDVETEADDDSDEEALPMMGNEPAPALAENDEVSLYHAELFDSSEEINIVDEEIAGTLESFFDEEIDSHLSAVSREANEGEAEGEAEFGGLKLSEDHILPEDVVIEASESVQLAEEERDENLTELDRQLDSFFDLGEDNEEGGTVPSPAEFPEKTVPAAEDVVVRGFDALEEEEVIFELVTDDDRANVGTFFDVPAAGFATEEALNIYGPLAACVDSLGLELDDKVIAGLWRELDHLRQNLIDKPLDKTFLLLLSTITGHIDRHRYESGSDAYGLLQSVCHALTELQGDDLHHNQELLFTETEKVLQWQEAMLAKQAAKYEAELTIGDMAAADQAGGQQDFSEPTSRIGAAEGKYGKDYGHQGEAKEPKGQNEAQEVPPSGEDAKTSGDLKQEISSLRQSLQDEIAELRKELKR